MISHYILVDRKPVLEKSLLKWAKWMEVADRSVANTRLIEGTRICTVFLGLDHSFDSRALLLFETCIFYDSSVVAPMMFNGRALLESEIIARYATWVEAELGHMELVEGFTASVPARTDFGA